MFTCIVAISEIDNVKKIKQHTVCTITISVIDEVYAYTLISIRRACFYPALDMWCHVLNREYCSKD